MLLKCFLTGSLAESPGRDKPGAKKFETNGHGNEVVKPFIPWTATRPVLWQMSIVERRRWLDGSEDLLAQCLIDHRKDVAFFPIGHYQSLPHFERIDLWRSLAWTSGVWFNSLIITKRTCLLALAGAGNLSIEASSIIRPYIGIKLLPHQKNTYHRAAARMHWQDTTRLQHHKA